MNAKVVRTVKHRGMSEKVKGLFLMNTNSMPLEEQFIIAAMKGEGYDEKVTKGALSYLCHAGGFLQRYTGKGGVRYDFANARPPARAEGTQIALLLDESEVLLQVEGQTMKLSPAAFRALRAKLRSLD